ncbi:MAG: muconate cycloisomerase [Phenylobacterium sp.]|nr:muconate cycloisomerase [Phenylobacterium sp.]
MSPLRRLEVAIEEWPLSKPFAISRGVDLSAIVVVVRITENGAVGWGESTPYGRYGETPQSVADAIEACREAIEREDGVSAKALGLRGAAANALDCALVDLACKRERTPAWRLLGQAQPRAIQTTATVTLDTPAKMAADAASWPDFNLLKLKLGEGDADIERVAAVRRARPDARLICDANEGWTVDQLANYAGALAGLGVEMVEQPCPEGADEGLRGLDIPLLLCADESCHVAADVESLVGKYQLASIKLDKAGGITGALELAQAAQAQGLEIMMGCMLATSLAIAPGILVGQLARYVDLDGSLTLVGDREPAVSYRDGMVYPAPEALWG